MSLSTIFLCKSKQSVVLPWLLCSWQIRPVSTKMFILQQISTNIVLVHLDIVCEHPFLVVTMVLLRYILNLNYQAPLFLN